MSDILKGELQDNQANTIYPHTEADVVFCADGETAQSKLTKYEDALGNVTGVTDSLEVDDSKVLVSSKALHKVNSSLEKLSSPTILWSGEIQPTTSEKVLTHVNLDMTDDIRNYNYLVITVDNNNSPTNHQYEDLYFIVQDIIDFGFNDNIRLQKTIVGNSTSMANVGFRIPDNNYNRLRVSVFNQGSYRAKILKIRGIK